MSAEQSRPPDLSLVIPAYNEAARLPAGIEQAVRWARERGLEMELIVVDDGSDDGTGEAAVRAVAGRAPLRVLRNEPNRGKGYSVRRGLLAARGEVVGFSDADFSTPVEEADRMLDAILRQGYDVAIGSRAARGAVLDRHQPWYREYAGRLFSLYYRALLIPGISDSQCGFKFFRREAARDILQRQTVTGWAFDAELLYIARRLGYSIVEVPVHWRNDPASKVRMLRDGPRMALDILRIRWRHRGLRAGGRPAQLEASADDH